MNSRYRLAALPFSLLMAISLVKTRGVNLWEVNHAMVQLAKCVVPIRWISCPDRAWSHTPNQLVPAAEVMERVRQTSGRCHRVLRRLELIAGDIAETNGQWAAAIARYRAAAALADIPAPGIWSAVVRIYMWKLKDYKAALTVAIQAVRDSPEDQDLRVNAAMLYLYYIPPYSGYREALAVMRPELGFTHPYYYNIAAGAYLGSGQLNEGMRMAQEAVRLSRATNDPNLATGLYLLGLMQRCTGQAGPGTENLREARALSPEDDRIRVALGVDISGLCMPCDEQRDRNVTR
jgi:tetratricopeptide (TPR) repeat protein